MAYGESLNLVPDEIARKNREEVDPEFGSAGGEIDALVGRIRGAKAARLAADKANAVRRLAEAQRRPAPPYGSGVQMPPTKNSGPGN